jgi:glycine/D-amino acid oxidase-like deaminating enzyme
MAEQVDVLVIGAGLMGAATAWSVARRGLSVTVLEQFAPHHALGSSHGSARIVRRVYGDELYVRLTGRAFELWREVEAGSGAPLLRMLGGLDFGPRRDVPAAAALLTDAGVEHELLDAVEAGRRWEGLRFDGPVLFHPQAGTLDSAGACTALLGLAAQNGAELRYSAAVQAIEPAADSARVVLADGAALSARCVVVAAGAWTGPLLAGLIALPALRVTKQQVFHFPRLDPGAPPWPSVIHEDARAMYHLAGGRDGGHGEDRKVGEHDLGRVVRAADLDGVIDPAARARTTEYVRRWLPGLEPTPRGESTCLYTVTPSEDFLLDRVGPIVVCSPCSGHGAKFAPLIGELTAGLVAGAAAVPDRFRLSAHAAGHQGSVSL